MNSDETAGEVLLGIAHDIRGSEIILFDEGSESPFEVETAIARMKVSLDFSKKPKSLQLRTLVEEWNIIRIIQEMY